MDVIQSPSPNFGPRRGVAGPDMVLLHHTAMRDAGAALARLSDPAFEVSAHYLIAEDGVVRQLVAEENRAWHAGVSAWGGMRDVNSHSIGIELSNAASLAAFPPFPEPQMRALERLLDGILRRWHIAPARVLGHSDVAPGRKADPGSKFDWRRLALGGTAVWPEVGAPEAVRDALAEFRRHARVAGYRGPESGDWRAVLDAFRLRFRPWARRTEIGAADVALAAALARDHPCIDPEPPTA